MTEWKRRLELRFRGLVEGLPTKGAAQFPPAAVKARLLMQMKTSPPKSNPGRRLRQEEFDLLHAILEGSGVGASLSTNSLVRDLTDGGMGSIEFLPECPGESRQAECIAEADYMDSDGIPVSLTVNVDQNQRLFELDIWKVDFGRLKTYPTARTIRNIKHLAG
jgi:hypothetical protein